MDRYIVSNILSRCSIRDQFKFKLVCTGWNQLINTTTWPEIYTFFAGQPFPWLYYAILKYYKHFQHNDKLWYFATANHNITPSMMFESIHIPWVARAIPFNPNITQHVGSDSSVFYSTFQRLWAGNLKAETISYQRVIQHMTRKWLVQQLSENPIVTWVVILNNPDVHWDWVYVSRNPNITWDIIRENRDRPWSWRDVSAHPNITWSIIVANPDIPWAWKWISRNPNITFDIVMSNLDKHWSWFGLSQHPNITWDIISANPQLPWKWIRVSANPNITWNIVVANPTIKWSWSQLSANSSIPWSVVLENMDRPWRWNFLVCKK
jgi:F-box domain